MTNELNVDQFLPTDGFAGSLIGRAWLPVATTGSIAGPSPVLVSQPGMFDLSSISPTTAELINNNFSVSDLDLKTLARVGSYEGIMQNTMSSSRDIETPYFLSPFDLPAIKACGVTFMCSMLERVIEECAGGDASRAEAVREKINSSIGVDVNTIEDVRRAEVSVKVEGAEDNFVLDDSSDMTKISRDGMGFTHKIGDVVTIASEKLGALQNTVVLCHDAPPWEFGISALTRNLAERGLL